MTTSENTSGITPKRLPKAHLFKIGDIVVGTRHRRDMGDVAGLAASMKELGLLHPIVVRPDGVLVAGERRLRAAKLLGWETIPVNIIDLEAVTRGEFAENAVRKDFTLSEAVAIKRALEPLEKARAKERMLDVIEIAYIESVRSRSGVGTIVRMLPGTLRGSFHD
jgi:ParB/RepB/Spo0J family partition protein